jgi:hypothetical protein
MLMTSILMSALAGCATDADCTVTTWTCCSCPAQRAVSKAELKAQEDQCATLDCTAPSSCSEGKPLDPNATAVCKAGKCVLSTAKPAKAECATAADCEVWCCQEDLQASVKGKKPRKGCKRCPKPQPAAECLEGKCQVAPHAL